MKSHKMFLWNNEEMKEMIKTINTGELCEQIFQVQVVNVVVSKQSNKKEEKTSFLSDGLNS